MGYTCTLCGGEAQLKSKQEHGGAVSIIIRCWEDGCPGHGVRYFHKDAKEATDVIRGTVK